jgi:hypothetical protein
MDLIIKEIIEILSCECEVIGPQEDSRVILEAYKKAKEEGVQSGFTPVILVPDERLLELMKAADQPEYYLEEAKKHNGKDILDGYLQEIKDCLKKQGEPWEEVVNTVERGQEIDEFIGYMPDDWNETLDVILAKIPTTHPWEVFAWVPMGGWNECPPTEYMIAVMKYWYETYKFRPVVITADMIEGSVPEKPESEEEATQIGIEHYAFCPDLIEQCCGDATIGQWADTLMKSNIWFFWWD